MSDSHRLNLTLSSKLQTALQSEADRMGLALTETVRSILVDGLVKRGAFRVPSSEPSKSTTVVKNSHINPNTHTNTDITQAERVKRLWKLRNEETTDALQRGWPIPTYDDNNHGRVWVNTGSASWEGEWITEAEAKRREEENDVLTADYEEETTS